MSEDCSLVWCSPNRLNGEHSRAIFMGHEADHSLSSSAEFVNEWSCTSTLHMSSWRTKVQLCLSSSSALAYGPYSLTSASFRMMAHVDVCFAFFLHHLTLIDSVFTEGFISFLASRVSNSITDYATTASFHTLSNSLSPTYSLIWRYIVYVTDRVVKYTFNKYDR
jgi:hypothetical protein